jgi:uncharacterized protein
MKILITGGTGFVGAGLSARLRGDGHEITILTRSARSEKTGPRGITYLAADPTVRGPWQEAVGDHDVIINLAGASLFNRWSPEYKRLLRESRLATTRNLVEAIPDRGDKQITFFSTSAVGYYGFRGDEELTEESPPGDDFLAGLAAEWEDVALRAQAKGARVVITRFGIVLGEGGGALSQMVPFFKMFIGGPLGSGRQWFSWIHRGDLAEAFVFLMKHQDISGPVNLCAPNPVRNRDLARALGRALNRPSFMPAPGFMIKLVLGELGSVILKGQKVLPRRLLDRGFVFRYPDIDAALRNIMDA